MDLWQHLLLLIGFILSILYLYFTGHLQNLLQLRVPSQAKTQKRQPPQLDFAAQYFFSGPPHLEPALLHSLPGCVSGLVSGLLPFCPSSQQSAGFAPNGGALPMRQAAQAAPPHPGDGCRTDRPSLVGA